MWMFEFMDGVEKRWGTGELVKEEKRDCQAKDQRKRCRLLFKVSESSTCASSDAIRRIRNERQKVKPIADNINTTKTAITKQNKIRWQGNGKRRERKTSGKTWIERRERKMRWKAWKRVIATIYSWVRGKGGEEVVGNSNSCWKFVRGRWEERRKAVNQSTERTIPSVRQSNKNFLMATFSLSAFCD